MRNIGKVDIGRMLKDAQLKHEEVSRALSADRTVVENLNTVVLSLQKAIKKNEEKKEQIGSEVNEIDATKGQKRAELDEVIVELRKTSTMVEEAQKSVFDFRKKTIELITENKELQNKLNKEFEETQNLLMGIIEEKKREYSSLSLDTEELKVNKNNLEYEIDSKNNYIKQLEEKIKEKLGEAVLAEQKVKSVEDLIERKKKAEREAKIAEQNLLKVKLDIKELRRNKAPLCAEDIV